MKRRLFNRSVLILLIVLMIFSSFAALAGIPSPGKDFYYYDEAGIMTTETKSMLYTNGKALEEACGAQIVVLVVNSLGGMKIEDYAYAVINEWGVGDKDEENGVVLVIDEKGGEYRMTIGTGLERHMNSAMVQRMLDGYFHPLFKEYKTDLAIRNLYAKLFEEIKSIYKLNIALVHGEDLPGEMMIYEEDKADGITMGEIITLGIIILIVVTVIRNNARKVSSVRPGTGSAPDTSPQQPTVIVKKDNSGSFWRGFIAGSINSAHRNSRHFGSFGSGSFGSSSRSSTRSSGGSFRSGGFGGARGGGGGGRGIGGGGRR